MRRPRSGQTSLLGSHAHRTGSADGRCATGTAAQRVADPTANGGAYPTTEQTLAAISLLLNGGGTGQGTGHHRAFSTAFAGREHDLRSLIGNLTDSSATLNEQTDDIIAATESFNNLVGQFADQKPLVDKALTTIPDALAVLARRTGPTSPKRSTGSGKFSAMAADVGQQDQAKPRRRNSKTSARCWSSLANAGPGADPLS